MNPFYDDFYTTPLQSDCVDTEADFKNQEHFFQNVCIQTQGISSFWCTMQAG